MNKHTLINKLSKEYRRLFELGHSEETSERMKEIDSRIAIFSKGGI